MNFLCLADLCQIYILVGTYNFNKYTQNLKSQATVLPRFVFASFSEVVLVHG